VHCCRVYGIAYSPPRFSETKGFSRDWGLSIEPLLFPAHKESTINLLPIATQKFYIFFVSAELTRPFLAVPKS
jgi:hypothetical protein